MNHTYLSLMNFPPSHCPACGKDIVVDAGDWIAGASHTCECGMSYQYAPGPVLAEVAGKHGDLLRYMKAGEFE